mmetsp:Transcript_4288/g.8458  ORF Transcript_4288/g.8458 Transcript_4288/m.8458 type:complete len:146 (+) Transcript_4288:2731-3168(+)
MVDWGEENTNASSDIRNRSELIHRALEQFRVEDPESFRFIWVLFTAAVRCSTPALCCQPVARGFASAGDPNEVDVTLIRRVIQSSNSSVRYRIADIRAEICFLEGHEMRPKLRFRTSDEGCMAASIAHRCFDITVLEGMIITSTP